MNSLLFFYIFPNFEPLKMTRKIRIQMMIILILIGSYLLCYEDIFRIRNPNFKILKPEVPFSDRKYFEN